MDNLISVALGGLIAILGGFFQAIYSNRNQYKYKINEKRETAYLQYIEALLTITVDDSEVVDHNDFFQIYNKARAQLMLYGSQKVLNADSEFKDSLYECFVAGIDVEGIVKKRQKIIDVLRKEIKSDKVY